jgi:archaellum component FlaG (FlaF/FlaG flagellin family)
LKILMIEIASPSHPFPLPPRDTESTEVICLNISSPSTGEGKGGGDLRYVINNTRGISVLFLVFAMLLMAAIGYIFSYLIPSKQKSVIFPIQSTQAFFIAQSGVEFAVRYAQDNNWTTTSALNANLNGFTTILGSGRFTLTYNSGNDTLTSIGEVPSASERRRISVSSFTSFLTQTQTLIIDPASPVPCWVITNQQVRFYIKNVGSSNITLSAFHATWTETKQTMIRWIQMDGSTRYSGNYQSDDPTAPFSINQAITPGQVVQVEVYWQHQRVSGNINIIFYDTIGESYAFNLNPTGSC